MAREIDIFVGQRIREARKQAGITLKELSAVLGIRFQQLQKYETGANRVSASRLWDIAEALEKPVSKFFPANEESLN